MLKEKEKNTSLLKKIKIEFKEWSLNTKYDGFSKIFEHKKFIIKMIRTLIFVAFTGATIWLVTTNFIEVFQL